MNTEKKIKWVLRIFCQWREHNLADPSCDPRICRSDLRFPSKLELSDVAYTLWRFLTEICKMNGSEYPPRTLYQMVLYFQMHFEMHKVYWKLLQKGDKSLTDLYYTLDNLMKKHTSEGLGCKCSTSVVMVNAEETMWHEGILGDSTPKQLSDIVLYVLGVNLALRGGEEHKHLCRPGFNP